MSRGISRPRERHVCEPTHIGSGIRQEPTPENEGSADIKVIAEGIQARKGDVASTAHQRNNVDTEPLKHHRHGKQENHGAAVHGEDLVVKVGPIKEFSGRISCSRMSAANTPPRSRKIKAVTMKRIPISV